MASPFKYSDCTKAQAALFKKIDGLKLAVGSTIGAVITEALDEINTKGIAQGNMDKRGKSRVYTEGSDPTAQWIESKPRTRRGESYRNEKRSWRSRRGWDPKNKFSERPNSVRAKAKARIFAKGAVTLRALSKSDRTFDKVIVKTDKNGVGTIRQGDLTVSIHRPSDKVALATLSYAGSIGKTFKLMDALKGTKKRPVVRKALLRAKNSYKKYMAYQLSKNGALK